MTRSIKDLIKDYKDTNELMSLDDFKLCIKEAKHHLAIVEQHESMNTVCKTHLNIAAWITVEVAACFDNQENLVNWIRGKSCSYYHPITRRKVEVKVRDDYEAIYMFLRYCMKLKQHESIDDDFISYLAYILCEPIEI